jgi:hypothetical protein
MAIKTYLKVLAAALLFAAVIGVAAVIVVLATAGP